MDEAILGTGGARGSGRTNDGCRGDGRDQRGRRRVRLTPAMLVVLLIAALCPWIPATPAGADGVGSIQELPAGFQPNFINNNGQIAGLLYGDGPTRAMVWSDGQLTELGGPAYRVHDFNDAGQAAVQMWDGTSSIEIRGPGGTRVLQKPVVGGEAKDLYKGWAPSESGEVIATRSWDSNTKSNGVRYQGAGPPTLITELATVFAANQTGQIFGQLDANPAAYAMIDNGALAGVGGYSGRYMYPTDFSNAGHVLYISDTGRHVWHEGSNTSITEGTPLRVNAEGVVLLQRPEPTGTSNRIGLRFDNGEVTDVRDLVGGAPGWKLLHSAVDLNDQCTVVGQGQTTDDRYAYFVAEVPNCEPVDIEGEFFRVDGGARYGKVGEEAELRLRVDNNTGVELADVAVTSVTVVEDDSEAKATVEGGTGEIGVLAGTGPESVGFLDLTLTGVDSGILDGAEAGTVTLAAEVIGTKDDEAVSGTIESEFEIRDTPVLVKVIPPEEPVQLEVREDGERDENGQLIDPSYIEQVVPVTVEVTVAQDADPVKDLAPFETVEGDGGIDIDLIRKEGDTYFDVVPQPVPFPATWEGPNPPPGENDEPGEFPVERIEPGETVVFELLVTVKNPGTFEIESIVEGVTDPEVGAPATVRGLGTGILPVNGDAVLAVEIHADRDQGAPPRIDEGGRAQFTGTVKNLSLTDTIRLSPVRAISLGQGQIVGPVELTEDFPAPGEYGFFEPVLEPGPGEESEATFKVAVDTTSLPGVGWELLSGRESVILDLAIKGTVVDTEGVEREIDPEVDVTLDVGNGKWTNGVRVEVDPKLNEQPLLTPDELVWALYGSTAESVVRAGYNFFANIPSMIKSIPVVLSAIGNGVVNLNEAAGEAALLGVQYAWTWAEYQAQVVLAMTPEEKQAELDAIAADLARLYDEDVAPVRAAVNQGAEAFFTSVLEYKGRADSAGARGDVAALIQQTAETTEVVTQVVLEEITGQAVVAWLAKAARSERATLALARAREKLNVEEVRKLEAATDEMRALQANPKVTQASPALKGVAPGTPVSQVQAIRATAIDRASDTNLRMLTKKRPIMVAMRSRADETLEWLQTRLGMTPKPVTVKPKNVNLDDCNFLGYRCGEIGYTTDGSRSLGDRGSVAMREPMERADVVRRLNEAGVDQMTRERVLKRHDKRWEEWYGNECPYAQIICIVPDPPLESDWSKMKKATPIRDFTADGLEVRRGTLEVPPAKHPPETADNFDTGGSSADHVYEERAFELREVKLDDGVSSWEVWLADDDGVLKRVSGDMDTVSVTYSDGRSFEPNSDYAREVALDLQEAVDAQHPWSSSLTDPDLRKKFLKAHMWDPDPLKRGEPLLIYVGGEARIGYFDPAKVAEMVSGTDTDPLGAVIWLEGGPNNIDATVKRQIDLRQKIIDPHSLATPQGHVTAETKVRSALLRANQEARVTRNAVEIQKTADRYATCAINASRNVKAPVAVWRMSDRLQQRQADGTWEDADPGADCDDGELIIFPETAITEPVSAGATVLPILEELLGFDWLDMFHIGDCITIDAGMPNEESACITDHGSLVLDRPLQFDHDRFARVIMDTPGDDPGDDPGENGDDSGDGSGTPGDGTGTPGGSTGTPGTNGGTGTAPGTPPGASPISYTADPPPPATGTNGTGSGSATNSGGSSAGGPLAFTGTGSRRVIYLGSLLALIGLAFVAAGDRRRRRTPVLRHSGRP